MPRVRPVVAIVTLAAAAVAGVAAVGPDAAAHAVAQARADTFTVRAGQPLQVGGAGVLRNDRGDLTTVVAHTAPAHGTLALQPDGSLRYAPAAGFTGTDTFRYTTTDAVHLYRTDLPPLATIDGVRITGGAYGSALTPVPGYRDQFYGLTDRGPNVDGPNGSKVEALPDFVPAIGRFRLAHGTATLLQRIPLRAGDDTPYDGQVNCAASTGETILDLQGRTLPCRDTGYDPEGLVALRDGTFWVSDEYGPLLTHFDRTGRQLGRLAPFDHSLPRELANRVPNRGMEGLTVTPDGNTLVGIMQSALQQPDLTKNPKNVAPIRIVTVDLTTLRTHEYLYLLDDPDSTGTAASEITALSAHEFLVDERDGDLEPGATKKLYRVDVSRATDVGPAARVPGATYTATKGGLLLGASAQTVEGLVGKSDTATARSLLAGAGVTVATKTLDVDLGALVTGLDPNGGFFGHDKVEGVATTDRGRTLVVANDNDFGVDGLANDAPPFRLHAKTLPDGTQDDGEYLTVDTDRLDHPTTSATVTIVVR
ncbi:Esterase-like activity of phytase [Jatrophihabitans endophyticus]|uniref:Esterase-like activity of phytase n=1 Tax=Jatrophihabitans endophyticus TaxID=1206085 RepID=A0A1M5MAF3_9ACTN|nr:esterase-like activity of phytase family protein [Jatrophihabitans endophyticus]SHG74272.1 Esterase-like activity of phytase [Jatrophihabitans endophyticus]